jgi:adhesin transport system outer membrane protein
LLTELLRVVTERASGGGASGADRERVRGRVANARATIADARAALVVAKRNLERLMGGTIDSVSVMLPAGLVVPGGLQGAKSLALAHNPDLLAARADLEASDIERLGYASRFLPRLSVELSHNRDVNAAGTESYFRDTKAMLVLTVPLVTGGTDYAQTRAAVARREEQRARAENVERKLMQELDAAYINLDAVPERYQSMLQEIASNRSVVAAFKDQLTASNRSLLDVLDAYQRFYQSRLDVTQLLVGETQNRLKIAHLSGTLLAAVGAAPAAAR